MESIKTLNSCGNLEKEERRGITIPDIKLYHKAIITKTAWYWHKNGLIEQCIQIETPEIDPNHCGKLIFDKGDKNIQWSKTDSF